MSQAPTDWTPRQRQIMRLMLKGARDKEAAAELGVSVHVVRLHIYRAMRRQKAKSRVQLANMFAEDTR